MILKLITFIGILNLTLSLENVTPTDSYSTEETCLEFQFRCPEGRCISKAWLCDGKADCPETRADESDSQCGGRALTLRDEDGEEVTEPDVVGYIEIDMGRGQKGYICDREWNRVKYNVQLKLCRELGFEGVTPQNPRPRNRSDTAERLGNNVVDISCTLDAALSNDSIWESCRFENGRDDCEPDILWMSCTNDTNIAKEEFSLIDTDGRNVNISSGALLYGTSMVCSSGFSDLEANIICEDMGFEGGSRAWSSGSMRYGYIRETVYVNCSGSGSTVDDCDVVEGQEYGCNYGENYLECRDNSTGPEPNNGFWLSNEQGESIMESGREALLMYQRGTVCDDNFNSRAADLICQQMGFDFSSSWTSSRGNFNRTITLDLPTSMDDVYCPPGVLYFWDCSYNTLNEDCSKDEDVYITCQRGKKSSMDFSLIDGNGEVVTEAGVEGLLLFKGGTVCDDDFNSRAADLICQDMGWKSASRFSSGQKFRDQDRFAITLDDVYCEDGDMVISDCYYNVESENCEHSEDVFLICSDGETSDETDVFYMLNSEGRRFNNSDVEGLLMYRNGTVCDDDFNSQSAKLICQQMGFDSAASWRSGYDYAEIQEQYPTALDNVYCSVEESVFWDCSYDEEDENCFHTEDIFITCEYRSVDNRVFEQLSEGTPAGVGYLLFGDPINGTMGTVCDDGFDEKTATLICQSMGHKKSIPATGTDYIYYKSYQNEYRNESSVALGDIDCGGDNITDIWSCEMETGNLTCDRGEDVFLVCSNETEQWETIGFYLVDVDAQTPSTNGEGLLFYKRSPSKAHGTVCDDDFNDNAANIICREMGYANGAQRWTSGNSLNDFQEGLPIVLDDVNCGSTAVMFRDCGFDVDEENCDHSEDVYLECNEGSSSTPDFSLVNQNGDELMWARTEGLLVYKNGTVCDDYFNDRAALLICQKMGFDGARRWRSFGYFSEWQQSRPITLDNVDCFDTSETFEDCNYEEFNENCNHNEDILLTCEYRGDEEDQFYLVNSNFENIEGANTRGLLMFNGGTVCDDGFNITAGHLICQEMGFGDAKEWTNGLEWDYQERLTINLDDIICGPLAHNFWNNCSYDRENEDCSHEEDVFLTCGQTSDNDELSESEFSLVDKKGNSFNDSSLEGLLLFRDGTVCDDSFNSFAADLICKAMGFESAQNWRHGYFNSTNDRYSILLDDVYCNSSHVSIEECQYVINDHNCDHGEDIILACSKQQRGVYQLQKTGQSWAVGVAYKGEYDHPQIEGWLCDDGLTDQTASWLCQDQLRFRYGKRAPSGPLLDGKPYLKTNVSCWDDECRDINYGDNGLTCNNNTERAAIYCYNALQEYDVNVQSFEVTPKGKVVIKLRLKYIKEGEVFSGHGDRAKSQISVDYCGQPVKLKGVYGQGGRYKISGKTSGRCESQCYTISIGDGFTHSTGCWD